MPTLNYAFRGDVQLTHYHTAIPLSVKFESINIYDVRSDVELQ